MTPTGASIRNAKPRDKLYKLSDSGGLQLLGSPGTPHITSYRGRDSFSSRCSSVVSKSAIRGGKGRALSSL